MMEELTKEAVRNISQSWGVELDPSMWYPFAFFENPQAAVDCIYDSIDYFRHSIPYMGFIFTTDFDNAKWMLDSWADKNSMLVTHGNGEVFFTVVGDYTARENGEADLKNKMTEEAWTRSAFIQANTQMPQKDRKEMVAWWMKLE